MGYMSIRSGPLDDMSLFMCCFVVLICKSGKKKKEMMIKSFLQIQKVKNLSFLLFTYALFL